MRFAVVQHSLRPAPARDLEALVFASVGAAVRGAETVFLPDVDALYEGPLCDEILRRIGEEAPELAVVVTHPDSASAGPFAGDMQPFGRAVLLRGDDCIDPEALIRAVAGAPGLAVLAPHSESELQAQAVLELAVGLSTSLASVIVIVEADGAEVGKPGHGGSAIVHLGQVIAEAMSGNDVLIADVEMPLGPPEAPQSLPAVPPVLLQRVAAHRGRKVDVGYPADLA